MASLPYSLTTTERLVFGYLQGWCNYGLFCMRVGAYGKAEECLTRAVAVDERHQHAVTAMVCLCLYLGQQGDVLYLDKAEVLGHQLNDACTSTALPWALLSLLYRGQGAVTQRAIGT